MKVQNYSEALYFEQTRRKKAGSFGYGDFGLRKNEEVYLGSAIADKILDDANASWTDEQIANAKAKWREMVLNLQNAVESRNEVIAAIKQMSEGTDKTLAIGQFNEADGIFMQAYAQAQPLFQQIGNVTGDEFPVAESANFGVIPLVIWGVVAASIVVVAAIASSMYEAHLKYDAIKANPAVAQYIDTGGGILGNILGSGATNKLIYGGLALLAISMFFKKKAA